MKELLSIVPYPYEKEFKQLSMEQCGWTADVYKNKKSGRTKLTPSERIVLKPIAIKLRNRARNNN